MYCQLQPRLNRKAIRISPFSMNLNQLEMARDNSGLKKKEPRNEEVGGACNGENCVGSAAKVSSSSRRTI